MSRLAGESITLSSSFPFLDQPCLLEHQNAQNVQRQSTRWRSCKHSTKCGTSGVSSARCAIRLWACTSTQQSMESRIVRHIIHALAESTPQSTPRERLLCKRQQHPCGSRTRPVIRPAIPPAIRARVRVGVNPRNPSKLRNILPHLHHQLPVLPNPPLSPLSLHLPRALQEIVAGAEKLFTENMSLPWEKFGTR